MNIKLYTVFESAVTPFNVIFSGKNSYAARLRKFDRLVLMRWPDGRPCHFANHWLMEICSQTRARDTARVYASHLSHFIRYCYSKKVDFFDFTDDDFFTLGEELQRLKKSNSYLIDEYVGKNHVRAVQQRCLHFLQWISQKYPLLSKRRLIGEDTENAQVTISYIINPYSGKREITHRYLAHLEPDKDDKGVITETTIQQILNTIFKAHDISNLPKHALTKKIADKELFLARNTYIYERRLFVIRMMKLTGLRPEELIDIPIDDNQSTLSTRRILIPTKKQGYPAPIRAFEIPVRSALDFQRYLDQRSEILNILRKRKIIFTTPQSILIGIDGRPLQKESLTREFSRLCKVAGITDIRSCLSMFRHRFITREMHLLMLTRFKKNPELKISWTPELREDICLIVKRKTGHKRTQSLYTYFDEEYKLLNSQPGREDRLGSIERLSANQEALIDLKFRARLNTDSDAETEINEIEDAVNKLYRKLLGDDCLE